MAGKISKKKRPGRSLRRALLLSKEGSEQRGVDLDIGSSDEEAARAEAKRERRRRTQRSRETEERNEGRRTIGSL